MAPTRSQRYKTKRTNQPGPSQVPLTQDTDDEGARQDQEEEADVNLDEEPIVGGLDAEINRKAADLVRLALFAEQRRTVLRRDEIMKKVLGSNTRLFNRVYVQANAILNKTFGMELVELPSRANINQSTNEADAQEDELDEARKATGMRKKMAASGSKSYMLRSILDPELIEAASQTDDQILEEEVKDAPEDDEDYEFSEGGYTPRNYGSIISWSRNEHPGPLGVLYVVLALILVNGRAIPDMELRSSLRRLRLPVGGEVAFSSISTHNTLTIDYYLASLIRQSYIDKEQVVDARSGKSKGNKRSRATQVVTQEDEDGGVAHQWRWAPRAYCEVGEKAIAKFVAEVMIGERTEADEEEEGGRAESSRRGRGRENGTAEAKMQKMLDGIEKAAGGNLTSLL
ncbi:MAGE domain containing protein [Amanita muscaria]